MVVVLIVFLQGHDVMDVLGLLLQHRVEPIEDRHPALEQLVVAGVASPLTEGRWTRRALGKSEACPAGHPHRHPPDASSGVKPCAEAWGPLAFAT
jgi:hypothetical protein